MKIAFVLFVSTPLAGQAGLSLNKDPEKALRIYSIYIEELLSQFNSSNVDILFSCEEKFQAVMISNHFARVKNCLIYPGTWGKRMTEITHYCGDYQDYDFIFIAPQEFSLITPEIINTYVKRLERTKRAVLLTSPDHQSLDLIGLNFPFQTIYQDIIWQKTDIFSQFKANLRNQGIPCIAVSEKLVLHNTSEELPQLASAFPRTCAILSTPH